MALSATERLEPSTKGNSEIRNFNMPSAAAASAFVGAAGVVGKAAPRGSNRMPVCWSKTWVVEDRSVWPEHGAGRDRRQLAKPPFAVIAVSRYLEALGDRLCVARPLRYRKKMECLEPTGTRFQHVVRREWQAHGPAGRIGIVEIRDEAEHRQDVSFGAFLAGGQILSENREREVGIVMRSAADRRYGADHPVNVAPSDVGHHCARGQPSFPVLGFARSGSSPKPATISLRLPASGAASRWMCSACARTVVRSSYGSRPACESAFGSVGTGSGSE